MNWRRGLLRAWAVISLCWVVVAFFAFSTPQKFHDARADVQFKHASDVLQFPAGTDLDVIKRAIANQIRIERKKAPPNYFNKFDPSPEQEAEAVISNYHPESVWAVLAQFLAEALLPPLLLLSMGIAIWWVVAGFRKNT